MTRISANLILVNEGWAAEPGLHMGYHQRQIPWHQNSGCALRCQWGLCAKFKAPLPSRKLVPSWMQDLREIPGKSCLFQQVKNISFAFLPRKRAACKSVNGSHKYKGNSKDVKPPDLWIHHERLELKPIDKSPDPNPIMTDTPIPRNSQDITPVDNSMDSNIHQRRNSYRGERPGGVKYILLCLVK